MALFVASATAQNRVAAVPSETPNPDYSAPYTGDADARWTESLGEPSLDVEHARADVSRGHYKSAARNLRRAAAILAQRAKGTYGLDRQRIGQDVEALRLTAKDVAAGAITTPALLDSVLGVTHAYLRKDEAAPR